MFHMSNLIVVAEILADDHLITVILEYGADLTKFLALSLNRIMTVTGQLEL